MLKTYMVELEVIRVYAFFTWLSGKFQLNSIVNYLTTKITKERQKILTFLLRVLRGYQCIT